MMRQTELIDRVGTYLPQFDEKILNRAYVYAMHKHRHQTRASGDPYFSHPLEVAAIVTDLRLDLASVIAALLHDTIEDTDATRREIDSMFGDDIGHLVDGLTKLKRIDLVSKKSRQGENLRRLLLAVATDVRVLLVKLADRLHNMRTLNHVEPEKRIRVAQETMDIYAPLAGRMGMQAMRDELEELAFAALLPDAHELIHEKLARLEQQSRDTIVEIERSLAKNLAERHIVAQVRSRSKKPYSVYRKMEKNSVSFEQLSDIIGFRVIVDRPEECYGALGIVHTRWPAVPGRFKDYISTPKENDYRSLHTTIAGPFHQRVELQIRTHEMNDLAEYGIAAHALYKDGIYTAEGEEGERTSPSRAYAWLRRTVDTLSQNEHPDDVLEHTRLELFLDQVFCFTPKGRLIALPQGATVIDFAYAVHTQIGDTCTAARINGRSVPVVSQLRNGDEVEVVRDANHVPPPAWEHVAVTGKAKAGIRRITREQRTRQYLSIGERILAASFRRAGHTFEQQALKPVLARLAHSSVQDAVAAVGRGELAADDVIHAVFPDYQRERIEQTKPTAQEGWFNLAGVTNFVFRVPGRRKKQDALDADAERERAVPFAGVADDVQVQIDPAAGALPGDRIVGILTPGAGITVYPIQAEALKAFEETADQWVDLRWELNEDNPHRFPAKVNVTAVNAPGTLAEVAEVFGKSDANIANLYLDGPNSGLTSMTVGVEVWDLKHLSRVLRAIRALDVVTHAERSMG